MAAGLLGCKPAAFSLCYKIFAFAFVLSFLHTMKNGSKDAGFCISACDDFKRRVRRCRFPRAAFDFSPVEIRHRHTSKSVQFCAERVRNSFVSSASNRLGVEKCRREDLKRFSRVCRNSECKRNGVFAFKMSKTCDLLGMRLLIPSEVPKAALCHFFLAILPFY